jgi:fatty acid desaturase
MTTRVLRHSNRDAVLIALAVAHGALLVTVPSAPLIAIGLWWNANTVAHNFIHLPFFRSRWANAFFSAYLSLLLGLPQTLWRDRHIAHHAGRSWRLRWSTSLVFEAALVLAAWIALTSLGPAFLVWTCIAGWLGGLLLCQLQGYFEHVRGTVSHYGALYNLAFFNDGYHVEHHARPGTHWTALPRTAPRDARGSRWPAVLRWLEMPYLDALERVVLHSRWLQSFVVGRHTRAFQRVLARLPPVHRVTIVGGGLFPRTALVLRRLAPLAELTIIDRSAENLRRARPHLDAFTRVVETPFTNDLCGGADLVVVPLAFVGDRRALYANPPAPAVAIHDWIWRRRGQGFVVSFLLLKRLNLVRR